MLQSFAKNLDPKRRLLLDVAVILAAIVLPWWLVLIIVLIIAWHIEYPEIIIVGAVLDALFSKVGFIYACALIFVILLYLKPRLSFHR